MKNYYIEKVIWAVNKQQVQRYKSLINWHFVIRNPDWLIQERSLQWFQTKSHKMWLSLEITFKISKNHLPFDASLNMSSSQLLKIIKSLILPSVWFWLKVNKISTFFIKETQEIFSSLFIKAKSMFKSMILM